MYNKNIQSILIMKSEIYKSTVLEQYEKFKNKYFVFFIKPLCHIKSMNNKLHINVSKQY